MTLQAKQEKGTLGAELAKMDDFGFVPSHVAVVRGMAVTEQYEGDEVRKLRKGAFIASKLRFKSCYTVGTVTLFFMGD